ncbi:MAG TPA: pyridoxamine 5'-phosphate oxidase [Ktedonobacterales bacterium]|jgi:pyridoxamine 5'-phosphate oxidase
MSLPDLRREYMLQGLSEGDLDSDPFRQFGLWLDQAIAAQLIEPNAMALATAAPDGRPSVRMVLLKGFDPSGFVFYTNYESRKGGELAANAYAALAFYWGALERQVRIEGRVSQVAAAQSDAYFHSRPAGSQLSAAASRQSQVIASRDALEAEVAALAARYPDQPVPRPDYWGGYRLAPDRIEFWQGRANRLHDRLRYRRDDPGAGAWIVERLSP